MNCEKEYSKYFQSPSNQPVYFGPHNQTQAFERVSLLRRVETITAQKAKMDSK